MAGKRKRTRNRRRKPDLVWRDGYWYLTDGKPRERRQVPTVRRNMLAATTGEVTSRRS